MVVHVQTKADNRNFSAAKFEILVTLFELRPHTQIISNWQTITRKLNKNHNNRSLSRIKHRKKEISFKLSEVIIQFDYKHKMSRTYRKLLP